MTWGHAGVLLLSVTVLGFYFAFARQAVARADSRESAEIGRPQNPPVSASREERSKVDEASHQPALNTALFAFWRKALEPVDVDIHIPVDPNLLIIREELHRTISKEEGTQEIDLPLVEDVDTEEPPDESRQELVEAFDRIVSESFDDAETERLRSWQEGTAEQGDG